MNKFDALYNSLINEDETPVSINTSDADVNALRLVQELQKSSSLPGDQFDKTVEKIVQTLVQYYDNKQLERCLILLNKLKQTPQNVFERFLTVSINGDYNSELKSKFLGSVLPAIKNTVQNTYSK